MKLPFFLRRQEPLRVACCADEHYAIGLTVMLRSLLETLPPPGRAEIHVLDAGLEPLSRDALLRTCADFDARIRFLEPDLARVAHLKAERGLPTAVYLRLTLPELVDGNRLLYLDGDLLVTDDVTPLWETDLSGFAVGAVEQWPLRPDSPAVSPGAPYCNSGLLLMDLALWREEGLGQRALAMAEERREVLRWEDQDALNAALDGRWLQLDPAWNAMTEAAEAFGWTPGTEEERARAEDVTARQRIIHFMTRYKPWWHHCPHPQAGLFLQTLDRTAYAGWRPDPSTEMPYPPATLGGTA